LLTVIDAFCAKLLFYCTQLRFVQLSNKAYDDDDDDDHFVSKISIIQTFS